MEGSVFDHDEGLDEAIKILLTIFKSRLSEEMLAKRSALTDDQHAVGEAFESLESWLWRWNWDLRGNYLRSGKIQLEDGEYVDAELAELQAEDERGEVRTSRFQYPLLEALSTRSFGIEIQYISVFGTYIMFQHPRPFF